MGLESDVNEADKPPWSFGRRRFLRAGIVSGVSMLTAGCPESLGGRSDIGKTDTATPTPTPTETETPTVNHVGGNSYIVDLKSALERNQSQPIFESYNTDRTWDDHEVNLDHADEWKRNDTEKYAVQDFIDRLVNEDLPGEPLDPYPGDADAYVHRKMLEAGNKANTPQGTFEAAMEWIHPAWLQYQSEEMGGMGSADTEKMGASIDDAMNQFFDIQTWYTAWGRNPAPGRSGKHHGGLLQSIDNILYTVEPTEDILTQAQNSPYKKGNVFYDEVTYALFRFPDDIPENVGYSELKGVATEMMGKLASLDFDGHEPLESSAAYADDWILSAAKPMRQGELPDQVVEQVQSNRSIKYQTGYGTILAGNYDDKPILAVGPEFEPLAERMKNEPGLGREDVIEFAESI